MAFYDLPASAPNASMIASPAAAAARSAGTCFAFVAALLAVCLGCQSDRDAEAINQPFMVQGARVEPESLNAYLATHRGFTSRGGEMRCAYKPLGQRGAKVFVWAVCAELIALDDYLVDGSAMSLPAAFQIEVDRGRPRVLGVEIPEDGDRYGPSIRRIFPASIWPVVDGSGSPRHPAAELGSYLRREAAARFGLPPSAATAPRRHDPPPGSHGPSAAALDSAARRIVAFLQGKVSFEQIPLSDSVSFYVAPEGGAGRATFTRDQLRNPRAWIVRSGRHDYSLAPSPRLTKLTTKVGRHFNCREEELAAKFPQLAQLPHVGSMLEPESGDSCLQTWSATFVFDKRVSPRVVGVVYDQWEW